MMDFLAKIFNGKQLVKFIIPIGIVIFIFLVFRWLIKNAPQKTLTDEIKVSSSDLTYPTAQYKIWAEDLYTAMDGAGTDEGAIIAIMEQLQSKVDFDMLVKCYGTRKLKAMFGVVSMTGTLTGCLRSELSTKEMAKVNGILAKIGVTI